MYRHPKHINCPNIVLKRSKPKPDAVATALFIGILHIFIKGTVIDPPPIPIKEDKAPIRDPIIGTAKPVGTETNTFKLLGPKMKCRETTIITNANNIIKNWADIIEAKKLAAKNEPTPIHRA